MTFLADTNERDVTINFLYLKDNKLRETFGIHSSRFLITTPISCSHLLSKVTRRTKLLIQYFWNESDVVIPAKDCLIYRRKRRNHCNLLFWIVLPPFFFFLNVLKLRLPGHIYVILVPVQKWLVLPFPVCFVQG